VSNYVRGTRVKLTVIEGLIDALADVPPAEWPKHIIATRDRLRDEMKRETKWRGRS